MRKSAIIGGTLTGALLLLAIVTWTPVADAQVRPSAGGGCAYPGPSPFQDTLAPRPGERNVGQFIAQARYAGVNPGSSIKLVASFSDQFGADVLTQFASSDLLPPTYHAGQIAQSESGTLLMRVNPRGQSDVFTFEVLDDGQTIGTFQCAIVAT